MTVPLNSAHLFAGGAGDTRGFDQAGYRVVYGANHDEDSVATLKANWPGAVIQQADINHLQMRALPDTDVLSGSPICTEVTPAGGHATPKAQLALDIDTGPQRVAPEWAATRNTALDITRAAEAKRYRAIVCENVPAFATRWPLFDWWLEGFGHLGYRVQVVSASAAHLDGDGFTPVPQDRNRMIVVFTRRDVREPDLRVTPRATCGMCGEVRGVQHWADGRRRIGTYGAGYRYVCPNRRCGHRQVTPIAPPVSEVLDLDTPAPRFGDGHRGGTPYVEATRVRVRAGLTRYGGAPFITILRNHCDAQPLSRPLTTVTGSGNHHYLTVPPGPGADVDDCLYRKLTVAERARAQGFPEEHVLCGRPTSQSMQIGNAVPVNAARWAAERLREVLT